MKTRWFTALSVASSLVVGCAPGQANDAAGTTGPQTITITANADGSFTPSVVTIKKGDTVTWVGLGRRDSVVHLADDAVDVCDPNDGAPYIPGGIDEFTGPWRTGVPGIFARGPTEPGQGPAVVPATMDCEQDTSPELATVDGVPSKYCAGQESLEQHLLTEMWDYPEINGALILFDWDAIETADDVYDFTDLDHEMTAAVRAGKSIRLGIRTGHEATPPWIFSAGVFPVHTKDTNNSDLSLSGSNCGSPAKLASPNDPVFRELWFDLIADLADHIHTNAGWTMAVNEWMLDGLNRVSDEAKLPKSCLLDGNKLATVNGDPCVCNPKVWAEAGYTPEALYEFYDLQRAAAQAAFGPISMSYRLIQDGFPKVASPTNFQGDTSFDIDGTTHLCAAGCSGSDDKELPSNTEQTTIVIEQGVNDEDADKFVTYHNGLDLLPQDQGAPQNCSWGLTNLADFPIFPHSAVDNEPGCPNHWSVNPGIVSGHITAGQVHNSGEGVDTPAQHESTLLSALLDSDYVSVEFYSAKIWDMHYDIGPNEAMDPTRFSLGCLNGDPATPSPGTISPVGAAPCNVAPFSHSMVEYNDMFTERRTIYPGAAYPSSHSHTFTTAHTVLRYGNPGVCSRGPGSVATIIVTE